MNRASTVKPAAPTTTKSKPADPKSTIEPGDPLDLAPHTEEGEIALLGALLMNPEAMSEVDFLAPEDFFILRHGYIFEAAQYLWERQEPIDTRTVAERLRVQGRLDDSGGEAYLNWLPTQIPTALHAPIYGKLVERAAIRRRLLGAAGKIAMLAHDEERDIEQVVDASETSLYEATGGKMESRMAHIRVAASEFHDEVEQRRDGERVGIPTGFTDLDRLLGGLHRGDLLTVAGRPGMGKCLGKDTPVMMADGRIAPVQDVQIGDRLMGPDGTPRTVLSLSSGVGPLYRVTPAKGTPYVVNENHVLSLRVSSPVSRYAKGEIVNVSIQEYFTLSEKVRHQAKGWRASFELPDKPLLIPPYILGAWLGDGSSEKPEITTPEPEMVSALEAYAASKGLRVRVEGSDNTAPSYYMGNGDSRKNSLTEALKHYGIWGRGNKRIPLEYLMNSRRNRLELLAGIVDTDGYLVSGCYEITAKSPELAQDIAWLARSLGFAAYPKPSRKTIKTLGFEGVYSRLFISGDIAQIPVRVPRRIAPSRRMNKDVTNVGITVCPVGDGEFYGFEVDGDHLFLLGDFTVTHNSAFGLSLVANMAPMGVRIGLFSIEMDKGQLMGRLTSIHAGISSQAIRLGQITDQEWAQIVNAIDVISGWNIVIDDSPSLSIQQLRKRIKRLMRQMGLDLVIVDYLGLMNDGGATAKSSNRVAEITYITRHMKEIAREFHIPVIQLAQLNRNVENRSDKRPRLADLRESGTVEQDSDIVMFLYRDEVYNEATEHPGEAEVIVAKHRNGPPGTVSLLYRKEITRFVNLRRARINLADLGGATPGWQSYAELTQGAAP